MRDATAVRSRRKCLGTRLRSAGGGDTVPGEQMAAGAIMEGESGYPAEERAVERPS
ncbi:MAG: hypothetical protein IH861_04750 [Chloroflexi bacterium]|nr:hypothetical protein [Chloroflexota bacterium]